MVTVEIVVCSLLVNRPGINGVRHDYSICHLFSEAGSVVAQEVHRVEHQATAHYRLRNLQGHDDARKRHGTACNVQDGKRVYIGGEPTPTVFPGAGTLAEDRRRDTR